MEQKIESLLSMPDLKDNWQAKRQVMLKDKIDVTAFYVWFIENYPKSVNILKENPEYQNRFSWKGRKEKKEPPAPKGEDPQPLKGGKRREERTPGP